MAEQSQSHSISLSVEWLEENSLDLDLRDDRLLLCIAGSGLQGVSRYSAAKDVL